MACSAASWLNCSTAGSTAVLSKAEVTPSLRTNASKSVKPTLARKCGTSVRLQLKQSSHSCKTGRYCFPLFRSSSSSFSVEEEEEEVMGEGAFEGSPEGSNIGEESREDVMKVVMQRLAEEDLEEAAKKYKYEDEIFSQIDFAQINAFTSKPFSGNPAAVCYLPYVRDDTWLQLIAREFNLPATSFVVKRRASRKNRSSESRDSSLIEVDDSGEGLKQVKKNVRVVENEFDIRWFSTTAELELCGHGTLASAHMLFSSGLVDGDTIIFHSKKGILKARKVGGYDEIEDSTDPSEEDEEDPEASMQSKVELGKGVVELDFPITVVSQVDISEAQTVSHALGVETVWVGRTPVGDYLVELPSCKDVEELEPLFERMMQLPNERGVIATASAPEGSEFDIVSRFFAPKIGIPEDPVTGSAHCTLGPYWTTKLGRESVQAYQPKFGSLGKSYQRYGHGRYSVLQASPRGGQLSVRVDLDAGRVYLQGSAVLLMAGTLLNTFHN